jgi:hypothetical protein
VVAVVERVSKTVHLFIMQNESHGTLTVLFSVFWKNLLKVKNVFLTNFKWRAVRKSQLLFALLNYYLAYKLFLSIFIQKSS